MPHLTGTDQTKVQTANQLYNAAIRLLQVCMSLGCLVSIENPARSWLWPLLALLVKSTHDPDFIAWFSGLESVYFDACAHGSSRDKRTKLLSTPGLFTPLAANCSQDHQHASWQPYRDEHGINFPTAAEAEYPKLLCDRMAQCVLSQAADMGVNPHFSPRLKDLLKMTMGTQSTKHPPLVPEYKMFVHTACAENNPAYKLLAAPFPTGAEDTEQPEPQEKPCKRSRTTYKYGVWHSPEEFLQRSSTGHHPMDHESALNQVTKDAIVKVVRSCPTKLAKERLAAVFQVRKVSQELKKQEDALKATMHPDVARCVSTKNILLFEHLLKQLDFWDLDVVNLLKFGIPLVGMQEPPAGYQKLLVPATMTVEELQNTAQWRRRCLMNSSRGFSCEEEQALLEATAAEVERGFLQGPYTQQELDVLLGEDWSLNPRFALFQGANNKIRVIDDAKQSGVNSAYSSMVKLQLQDVDYAAAMVLGAMQAASTSDVAILEWCGKTFDLSKAYKQLAVLPEHQKHAVVGFPVQGVWKLYKSISLPFGCTGSVYGFIRISQALWFIVSKILHAITSHYFDDFPTIERSEGCRVLTLAFSAVLDLLGWEHAKEGDKAQNFAPIFDLLGVTFDLKRMSGGFLQISNKVSRIEKLCAMLDRIHTSGTINPAKASEIQGLLNFAVSFYMGRGLKHLVSAFAPFAESQKAARTDQLKNLCAYAKALLHKQLPRLHSINWSGNPVLIFTDGAWEDGKATAGAVLVKDEIRLALAIEVPKILIDHWLKHAGSQIISQIELWALVALRWQKRELLRDCKIIEWIDNESARICSLKATSPSPTMQALARMLAYIDLEWPTNSWTERVCSYSNPADLPSRGRTAEACSRFNLVDGGTIDSLDELSAQLIQMHNNPYQAALSTQGTKTEHLGTK